MELWQRSVYGATVAVADTDATAPLNYFIFGVISNIKCGRRRDRQPIVGVAAVCKQTRSST